MTPQEAKLLAPIIAAYGDGETIQAANKGHDNWEDQELPSFQYADSLDYRIKPKPRLVPMTHEDLPPVFWVRRKENNTFYLVTEIDYNGDLWANGNRIELSDYEWSPDRKTWQDFTKEVAE